MRRRCAGKFLPARFKYKLSIDIADRNGSALRRRLRSAERLSDNAMRRGSSQVKTPPRRSSASLCWVTSADHCWAIAPPGGRQTQAAA